MALTNLQQWLNYNRHHDGHWHRQCLVLQCTPDEIEHAQTLLADLIDPSCSVAVLGHTPAQQPAWPGNTTATYPINQYRQLLGREFDIGIYYGYSGFRPNALLALAGTVQRAGRLIILSPPVSRWPYHDSITQPHFLSYGYCLSHSQYLQHFLSRLLAHPATAIASAGELSQAHLPVIQATPETTPVPPPFKTNDQHSAFNKLCHYTGTVSKVFLTAPRGRGKSTLLAFLAAHLLKTGRQPCLTSSLQQSQQVFYSMLADTLELTNRQAIQAVPWVAPDNPRLTDSSIDILLIDEAASLPLPVVTAITRSQQHCVMSSTVLGFEGSGKGFTYKFMQPALDSGQAVHIKLQTPVRWYNNDPVEQVCNRYLLHDAGENTVPAIHKGIKTISCASEALSASQLSAVLNLLSLAHYQTTPDDMMRLIDSPDCRLFVSWQSEQPVAAAIINHEGGQRLSKVAHLIATGERRVKGHLSAQSVSFLSATSDYATQKFWRVNRIAVHPALQRRGLGHKLLREVITAANQNRADWLSTSFAYDEGVTSFWQHAGFTQLRHGSKADKASGQPSLLMLLPLSDPAINKLPVLQQLADFDACTPSQLPLQVAPGLAAILQSRLDAYCKEARHSQSLGNTLHYAVRAAASAGELVPELLQDKYLHCMTNHELLKKHSLEGKAALERALLQVCQKAQGVLVKFVYR